MSCLMGPVYFGHPLSFWRGRHGDRQLRTSQVEQQRHLEAVVSHEDAMLRRQVLCHVEARVERKLALAEREVEAKRERLRELLERERDAYILELAALRNSEQCRSCEEWSSKTRLYEEEIEKEKLLECQRALEREKIACGGGVRSAGMEETELRRMQRLQVTEREHIERAERERDGMWHQVLMEDWRNKEMAAAREEDRRAREMTATRRAYDEQVASARRMRVETASAERERERERLEGLRRAAEREREEAIRMKEEHQKSLVQYFEEERERKMARRMQDKMAERALDDAHIQRCQVELQKERQRQRELMHKLRTEKTVFLENYRAERREAAALQQESERAGDLCGARAQSEADELYRQREEARRRQREEAAGLYKQHQKATLAADGEQRLRRDNIAARVRETALENVRRDLSETERELEQQKEYRESLSAQIRSSREALEREKCIIEHQQKPFVKKAETFRDVMQRVDQRDQPSVRPSDLPVHPFARVLAQMPTDEDKY